MSVDMTTQIDASIGCEVQPVPSNVEWLRVPARARVIGVDRDAKVIRGYVLAQAGPFKTPGRGEFDSKALKEIVRLGNAERLGLKSRFAHPTLSDDGIGRYLGRVRNLWLGRVVKVIGGVPTEVEAVRGDLHLDPTAFSTPNGDLGSYVLALAESDSEALSSSLVMQPDVRLRMDKHGRPIQDESGADLPPLWFPLSLHASDIVDTGDAVDGLLSVAGMPDESVRLASSILDRQFPGASESDIRKKCLAWLDRYLCHRFGHAVAEDCESQIDKSCFAVKLPVRVDSLRRRLAAKVRAISLRGDRI